MENMETGLNRLHSYHLPNYHINLLLGEAL